jgi:glyoxylase-like metal-dependent hydrolase (beta-lactamase superfamily II)
MDTIHLPSYEVMPLNDIAPDLKGVRLLFVNVYAVGNATDGWTLIDTGIPFSAGKIKHWAETLFGKNTKPRAIILTHGHFDHVGAVRALVDDWEVPVYAHAAEFPYLTGHQKYPPPDPGVGGGLMAVMSPLFPRSSADLGGRVQELPADGTIPGMPGWRYLHTPGHAPGHVSLFRENDRVLVAGDAICTTKQESFLAVAKQTPELHGPPAYYTPDWNAARDSVRALADLQPRTIAPGHGLPMCGDQVPEQINRLAREFDHYALPHSGKYARAADATAVK